MAQDAVVLNLDKKTPQVQIDNSNSQLRADGVYMALMVKGRPPASYLRFYPNSKEVISVSSIHTHPNKLSEWFKKDSSSSHIKPVPYILNNHHLTFSDILPKGKINYSGLVNNQTIIMNVHSEITNYESTKEYNFVPFEKEENKAIAKGTPQYSGIYQNTRRQWAIDAFRDYLRFYPDGTVIRYFFYDGSFIPKSKKRALEQLKDNFNKENMRNSAGYWTINNGLINFFIYTKRAKLDYSGRVEADKLHFKRFLNQDGQNITDEYYEFLPWLLLEQAEERLPESLIID